MPLSDLAPYLLPTAGGAAAASFAALAYAYLAPASRAFLPMVCRGPASAASVALTFDDGPRPDGTSPILDLLAEHAVQAAFFVIGANVHRFPDLVRRMDAEGHLVCNHSYDHLHFGALRSRAFWRDQIRRTDEAIEDTIGRAPAFFRPPLGHKSPSMRLPVIEHAKTPIGWTRRAFDTLPLSPETIVRRLSVASAGDVLILHDGREPRSRRSPASTVAAITPLITAIHSRGLRFTRLDAHLGLDAYLPTRTASPIPAGA